MVWNKKLMKSLAGLLIYGLSMSVHAGFIEWTYEATIAVQPSLSDVLGIDGDPLSITLIYDDTDVWLTFADPTELYFPTTTASASISGHTVTLNTASPAAQAGISTVPSVQNVVEQLDSNNIMDLIIDGNLTTMLGLPATTVTALTPSAGDNLVVDHLTAVSDIFTNISFGALSDPHRTAYDLVDASITVTTSSVPGPSILTLMGIGLIGMGFFRKRMNAV